MKIPEEKADGTYEGYPYRVWFCGGNSYAQTLAIWLDLTWFSLRLKVKRWWRSHRTRK